MVVSRSLSSLCCELRILEAKNIEQKSHGNVFVRCYLFAGNNKRSVQLNSQEICSNSEQINLVWNESFSLECLGDEQSLNQLKQQTVVFELRWRSTKPVLGKMMMGRKSKVLGRAEMPWKAVFESPDGEIEKCVPINGHVVEGLKPPSLKIGMKVRCPAMVEMEKKNKDSVTKMKKNWDECGCNESIGGGCRCADYELFALAAAFEGF